MTATPLGRYVLFDAIATGGMSSVHLGRMIGSAGFGRTVAVKRLHPQFAGDPTFVSMMLDEARLVSRIHHPNVVATLDVFHDGDLFLVMEYVPGETLATLARLRAGTSDPALPTPIARAIAVDLLLGLDAAHEARDEEGAPLGLVHRDVSPQNVMVGTDGRARVLDFGVAKAVDSSHQSEAGTVKGKVAYMSPEQLRSGAIERTSDVYGAAVVLWEMVTGQRLFGNAEKTQIPFLVSTGAIRPPRRVCPSVDEDLEDVIMKGLEPEPERRFATAKEMAIAVEKSGPLASAREVADWLVAEADASLAARAALVAKIERETARRIDVRELATKIVERRVTTLTPDPAIPIEIATPAAEAAPASGRAPRRSRRTASLIVILAVVGLGGLLAGVRPWRSAPASAARPEVSSAETAGAGAAPAIASTAPSTPAPELAPPAAPPHTNASVAREPTRTPPATRNRGTLPPRPAASSPPNNHGLFDRN